MNRVKSTYWPDNLLARQQVGTAVTGWGRDDARAAQSGWWQTLVGTRAEVRQRGGIIPTWVPMTAIILTGLMLCASAITRTRSAMHAASARYNSELATVEKIRQDTATLRVKVQKFQQDPAAVADAAHQYGMIRANERIVTVRSR